MLSRFPLVPGLRRKGKQKRKENELLSINLKFQKVQGFYFKIVTFVPKITILSQFFLFVKKQISL